MRQLLIAAVFLVATTPSLAQDKTTAPAPEKKICRSITPTGSIMGKRFCLTSAEWKQLNSKTQADSDNFFSKRGNANRSPREPGD